MAASPRENTVVTRILKFLNEQPGCKAIKIHGGGYQEAGTPDILGCYQGRMIAFEVKRPGGSYKATPLQIKRLEEWNAAGALTAIVTSVDEVREALTTIDNK